MRANMYVLPIEIQGALSTFAKEYIGPVPAEETLIIAEPKVSFAACSTCLTNGSLIGVLAASLAVYELHLDV